MKLDLDGFLEWENRQNERFERLDGVVRLTSGGTAAHDRIAGNLYVALRSRLRDPDACNVHLSNLKVVARDRRGDVPRTCSSAAAGCCNRSCRRTIPSWSSRCSPRRPPSAI